MKSPIRRISSTICSADFSRAPGMSRPPAGNRRDAERDAQHVVDDVVVRVVELEPADALGAVVGAQRKVQELVRQHEDQLVVVEPRGEGRIGDQTAGREHAHGRHALVDVDAHRGREPRQCGSGTVSIRSPFSMRARMLRGRAAACASPAVMWR